MIQMHKNKKIKIGIVILIIIIVSIPIILYNLPQKLDYCGNVKSAYQKNTNYEHNGINYRIDKEKNRVNKSRKIPKKHENTIEENQVKGLYLENMKIVSKKCDEAKAYVYATMTNNTGRDFKNLYIQINYKNKKNENQSFIFEKIGDISNGETKELEIMTFARVIDAYNYDFVYIDDANTSYNQ